MARSVVARDELEHAFRRLTPEQRAVVVLHHHLGYPLTEIAATLGIPEGTARSRLHYAVRQLRAALDDPKRVPRDVRGATGMSRPTIDPDFEPRVADWLEADPDSAPAAVLGTVLAALPSIPQRRASRVPWRFPTMSSFAKVAIAAVAVVAVGTVGVIALRPGGTGNVGSAPSTLALAFAHARRPRRAVANGAPSPPATDRIVHVVHARDLALVSRRMDHEAGHGAVDDRRAHFADPSGDFLYDPLLDDHLFIGLASQPLAGKTG